MSINSVVSAGLQGVQAGYSRANQASWQIARSGGSLDGGDFAAPLIDLKVSEIQVKASASVLKSGDQMLGTLIDIAA